MKLHPIIKAINGLRTLDSETGLRIETNARNRAKRLNKDFLISPYLVDICKWLDIIQERQLTQRELYNFNELFAKALGGLLQQEMDDNEIRWS